MKSIFPRSLLFSLLVVILGVSIGRSDTTTPAAVPAPVTTAPVPTATLTILTHAPAAAPTTTESAQDKVLKAQIKTAELELDLLKAQTDLMRYKASDQANGVYKFFDDVTDTSVKKAIDDLDIMGRMRPKQPITFVLNSPGGSVFQGLALYDELRSLSSQGHHITVVVRGMAASMGGIVLQAGDTRVVGKESMILIHEVGSSTSGKVSAMRDDVSFSAVLWTKLSRILAQRSTMPVPDPADPHAFIAKPNLDQRADAIRAKAFKLDWWLESDEAINLGFADKIE